jgi:ADP-ribose pyrophosphatase YjhB (NUDIX family)
VTRAARDSHCSFCGHRYEADLAWPRTCAGCGGTTYKNPLPVAVVLVPVGGGLLAVRRGIPPAVGKLALPGGYIGLGETWQEAGAREVFEETGVRIDPAGIDDFRVRSASDGTLLVFGLAREIPESALSGLTLSEEATEILILRGAEDLAFELHAEAVRAFFARGEPRS